MTSEARDTRRSMMAVGDAADTVEDDVPERPPADGPSANDVEKPPAPGRATVRLEAANVEAPVDTGRATVKLQAVDTEPQPAGDLHSRATAELSAVAPAPEAEPEEPVTFAPPPTPMPTKPAEEPTAAEAKPKKKKKSKAKVDPYRGDLLADVTDYRSFRLRLQRGEIPTGDEVAAMIDLEAVLREPPAESSPHRDVVTQRFFRRFPFDASVTARFTHGGEIHEVKGKVSNLSVDGLQCVLELDGFEPKRDQHAMLIIDCTRGFLDVRYSITARVVYSRRGKVGFVFAGVPSWAERGEHQHVETAVRARPKPEA